MGFKASSTTVFGKGTTALNAGIGLLNFGSYAGLAFGSSNFSQTPLINVSVEHGILDDVGPGVVSIGGIVGYRRATYDYASYYKWSASDLFIGVRGIYHYTPSSNPKLDTYGGLTIGLRRYSYNYDYDAAYAGLLNSGNSSYTSAFSGLFVGARYMFAGNIGAFGEFGYDIALLKIGITAKF